MSEIEEEQIDPPTEKFLQTHMQIASGIVCKIMATAGATVTTQVDFTVDGCSFEEAIVHIKEWAKTTGREEEFENAWKEKENSGKGGNSFIFGLISIGAEGTYAEGAQKSKMTITDNDNKFTKELMDHIFKLSERKNRFYGKMRMTGTNPESSTSSLVVQIMVITRNGRSMRIVNHENLKIVNAKGDISGKTESKLNLKTLE